MFDWIRAKIKSAILLGVNDAMRELQGPRPAVEAEPVQLQLEYQPEPGEPRAAQKRGKS